MLTIEKEVLTEGVLRVRLTGLLDGHTNLRTALGLSMKMLHVNCGKVRHVNSSGVKAWMEFFEATRGAGIQLVFEELPDGLIDYANHVSNFLSGGVVASAWIPFFCPRCKHETSNLIQNPKLETIQTQLAAQKCKSCGGQLDFDDDPENYFRFLKFSA